MISPDLSSGPLICHVLTGLILLSEKRHIKLTCPPPATHKHPHSMFSNELFGMNAFLPGKCIYMYI